MRFVELLAPFCGIVCQIMLTSDVSVPDLSFLPQYFFIVFSVLNFHVMKMSLRKSELNSDSRNAYTEHK